MKLIIKYILISIILLCAITLFLLCGTEKGLMLDIHILSRFLPGQIKIEHVSGTLFSAFSLQHISYQYAGQHITVQSVNVQWYPSRLLKGNIALDTLSIKEAHIQLTHFPTDTDNQSVTNIEAIHSKLSFLKYITFNQFILENSSLQKNEQWITLEGKIDHQWDIQWAFHLPNINALIVDVNGSLQGTGTISGPRFAPTIHVTMNGGPLMYGEQKISTLHMLADIVLQPGKHSSLILKASGIKIDDHSFDTIKLNTTGVVNSIKKTLSTSLEVNVSNDFKLNINVSLPAFSGFHHLKQPIAGTIIFTAKDLSILDTFIPDIKNAHGILEGRVKIQGMLANPEWMSDFTLTNGRFSLPILGIQPDHISAQGHMDNQRHLVFTAHLHSGSGTAQLQGSCDLTQSTFPLTLAVQGTYLDIIQLPEYKASASPDITLLFNYPSLQLQGNVTIPEAKITPKNITSTLTLPEEVIFVNEQKPKTNASPVLLTLQLNLHLGDHVNVDYEHLKATLRGDITIEKMADSPPKASGELYTVQGNYTAYGQKLMIETGRLIYTGNTLMNPGLNIRAAKQVRRVVTYNDSHFIGTSALKNVPIDTENLSVGVEVAGTADSPKISLFSIPAGLSQGDILSYLLLGLPQSQASGAQGSALFTALSAYDPQASNVLGVTHTLQHTFGLTELNVESIETFNPNTQSVESTTSFVVGKQITQKISVHYSIGLFNPISILNLRYQINPHWAVQSETSTIDSGADLLYGFERD
jgi:translocation and assembly module TamB